MNALELAEILEFALEKDNWCQECGLENTKPIAKNAADMLRQQAKEIEQLTITNQDLKYQLIKKSGEQVLDDFSKDMLQKQSKDIEQLKADLKIVMDELVKETDENSFWHNKCNAQAKEIEDFRFVLRNLTLATSKKIGELEEELEVKGRLPQQSLVEDLNDMHIAKSILRAENHFKFGENK